MEAGQEFGIAPFGVEAQRVLRLEKKHIIPAQDTDAVSNPLEADMAWVARMQKDDFIGKQGLRAVQERGLRDSLVGFVMSDSVVPRDGDPVVADGQPVGHVTSSRYSHVLGKGIGLAWVPVSMSEEDTEIGVLVNGKPVAGRVVTQPFYDPDGGRLRE
jgi:sarcosine oxidase subunit alpha